MAETPSTCWKLYNSFFLATKDLIGCSALLDLVKHTKAL
jgi:hypothetical protein